MSRFNFRNDARVALGRARALLKSGQDPDVRYAALELRFAIEAIIYGKAESFQAELPLSEYGEWRPKQILQALLDIDPMADQPVVLRAARQARKGEAAENLRIVGSETPLDIGTIKRHYDALGNILHSPTARQLAEGKGHDLAKLRTRCDQLADALERVLASPIFNINMGVFSSWPCGRCGATVRRRLPRDPGPVEAHCPACSAPYLGDHDGEIARWERVEQPVDCLNPDCDAQGALWVDQLKEGATWACHGCGKRHRLSLCVEAVAVEPESAV